MSENSAFNRPRDTVRPPPSPRSASTTPRQAMAAQESIEHMDEDDDPLPLPADAEELRQSFGDRKPPDITRKITACVACRKQKIKCDMPQGRSPCTRCRKRGLSCTVNRSLQMLLEDDATWKNSLARKVQNLEAQINELRHGMQNSQAGSTFLPSPARVSNSSASHGRSEGRKSVHEYRSHTGELNQQSWEVVMDPDSGPATIPAAIVSQVGATVSPTGPIPKEQADLVTRGTLTLEEAQELFDLYANRLDHFLYNILGEHRSFAKVRQDSPLLLAATCTVGALHSSSLAHMYDKCYRRFLSLSASQTFSRDNTLGDVKGLCIGAFWLCDISWNLVGIAVRIATQMQLHRSIKRALNNDRAAYFETRLYYLVYTCDHHFSLAYGRPPMTRDDESIAQATALLHTANATEDDARLVSQVNIWAISSAAYETFGIDVDSPIRPNLLPKLRRYMIALDTWRADWGERFVSNAHVGDYPRKGVGLHYFFAKLYLCSHAFRGVTPDDSSQSAQRRHSATAHDLPPELEEVASAAVVCAKAILRTIVDDPEMQAHLNGLPLYFNTMIAFAVVFLLKVARRFHSAVRISGSEILLLVRDMGTVLRQVASNLHRQHLLRFIAEGVGKLISKIHDSVHPHPPPTLQTGLSQPGQQPMSYDRTQPSVEEFGFMDTVDTNFNWMENITNFDLLSSQNTFTSLESWPFGFDGQNPPPNA